MFCSECGLLLLYLNLFNCSNVSSVYFFSDFLPLEIVFPQLGTALQLDLKQSNCKRSLPSYFQKNGKYVFARTYNGNLGTVRKSVRRCLAISKLYRQYRWKAYYHQVPQSNRVLSFLLFEQIFNSTYGYCCPGLQIYLCRYRRLWQKQ